MNETPSQPSKPPEVSTPPSEAKPSDKVAPPLGTDQRPIQPPAEVKEKDLKNTTHENTEKGKLGDGGPSAGPDGKNRGNLHGEEEQPPQQNATAGGPDVGTTPANAPGMSHS